METTINWRQFASLVLLLLLLLGLFAPIASRAAPNVFGGPVLFIRGCFADPAIYTLVGPPRPGAFIWRSSTRTYQYGPPRRTGQYLLGLYGVPYFCVINISPLVVLTGRYITMMGSSR